MRKRPVMGENDESRHTSQGPTRRNSCPNNRLQMMPARPKRQAGGSFHRSSGFDPTDGSLAGVELGRILVGPWAIESQDTAAPLRVKPER